MSSTLSFDEGQLELRAWSATDLSLSGAIALTPHESCGITWSPNEVLLSRVVNGVAIGENGAGINLDGCFEARIFGEWGEIRWLSQFGPTTTVAVGLDIPGVPLNGKEVQSRLALGSIAVSHLVWGTTLANDDANDDAEGWSTTAEHRIGTLRIPCSSSGERERIALDSVEYISQDEHGNAVVMEELLKGFRVVTQEKTNA
jgi:CRISPR-associated protein (TIGR03984 family)